MFCKNCGNKLTANSKYCGKCGTLASGADTADQKDSTEENFKKSNSISKNTEDLHESYVAKIIRDKSRRRLYAGYFLLASAIIIFIYQHNYIANLISGPRSISDTALEDELLSGNIKDININLQLSPNSVYQAGYTHVTQTLNKGTNQVESETTDSEYYMTIIGKHILVLEGSPNNTPSGNFEGVVDSLSPELQNNIVSDFNNDPELKGLDASILPYIISNKGMTGLDDFWLFLFGLGLFCVGGYITYKRSIDREDKKHYAYQVASLAGYSSIDELSNDFIQSEKTGTVKIGGYTLSNKFLFIDNHFSFRIYPLSQMYWSYKKIVKKSVNFVPTGKDYEIVMHFRPKQVVAIKEPEESVNQHLMLLMKLCPGAKFGYTKE
jgi:hypothetical protein